jgi:hypothetical protein
MTMLELHTSEVVSVAEARALAAMVIFPEQDAKPPGTVAALAQSVNTLTAMVNELAVMVNRSADENDYLRRKVERLEQILSNAKTS